ncbi:MAG: hypothetical protein ABIH18_09035 [Candidatus Omnitrophota bacterium]
MTNKLVNKSFIIIFIILLCCNFVNAMESATSMKMYRDTGTIGEKKTLHAGKVYYEPKTGSTFHFPKKGTFVTPLVIGNVAYFDLNGMYSFKFECLNWKYSIAAYWSSADIPEGKVGFSTSLESPDKEISIKIKEVDIPVSGSLSTSPTQEQLDAIQLKGYVEDPFISDERVLVAQQAIKWIIDNDLDGYKVVNEVPINFTSENIGNKLFVKIAIDIFSKKKNVTKKCIIWALNCRGYRFKKKVSVRWAETWVCQLISDSSDYLSTVAQTHMILETLKFDRGRNVYPNLIN